MECFLKELKGKRQTQRRLSHICEQRCQCRSRTSSLLASERDLLSALRSCIDLPAVVQQRSDLSSSVYFSPPFHMLVQTQQIHTPIHSLTLSHTHTLANTHTQTQTGQDHLIWISQVILTISKDHNPSLNQTFKGVDKGCAFLLSVCVTQTHTDAHTHTHQNRRALPIWVCLACMIFPPGSLRESDALQ